LGHTRDVVVRQWLHNGEAWICARDSSCAFCNK